MSQKHPFYPRITGGEPISWTSKHGSLTFNPWGREVPFEGMNEAGLVVSALRLELTKFPAPDARPAIPGGQWVQYQLDTAATVADVIASNAEMRTATARISPTFLYVTVWAIVPLLSSLME